MRRKLSQKEKEEKEKEKNRIIRQKKYVFGNLENIQNDQRYKHLYAVP